MLTIQGKDSYRQLQDAFYTHMIEHGFKLERGQANNSEHVSTLQNTVNKLISWVSSIFKITEDSIIDTFENETNTYINPMEQLLSENKSLMNDLEHQLNI